MSQERIMLLMAIIFFSGIGLYVLLPEGAPRGLGMTLFSVALVWTLMRATKPEKRPPLEEVPAQENSSQSV
jgi:multisubunit Na+/H+ antiporter MnhC subunit